MSPYPVITRELTNQVVSAEFLLPILLLIPVARLQLAAIVGLVVMHSCFGLALHLEAFTPLAIVCMAGFIPRLVWNRWSGVQRAFERFFHLFGRFSLCGPSGERFKALGSISSAFLTWGTLGILWSCASATNSAPPPASDKIMEPWHVFSLQQGWGMFVPPPFQGGWYVFRGKTMRGDWVNLEVPSGFADSLGRPEPMDQNVPSSRHYLLYNSLLFKAKQMQPLQEKVALNFRLRWEQDHPGLLDRLQQVEIYRYYREYDSEADKFSTPELYYSYKKITL